MNHNYGYPTTRRFSRSMSESFGPYHSGLTEPKPRTSLAWKVVYVLTLVAVALVVYLVRSGK